MVDIGQFIFNAMSDVLAMQRIRAPAAFTSLAKLSRKIPLIAPEEFNCDHKGYSYVERCDLTRAPSQYKDRLIYVWRFPC